MKVANKTLAGAKVLKAALTMSAAGVGPSIATLLVLIKPMNGKALRRRTNHAALGARELPPSTGNSPGRGPVPPLVRILLTARPMDEGGEAFRNFSSQRREGSDPNLTTSVGVGA